MRKHGLGLLTERTVPHARVAMSAGVRSTRVVLAPVDYLRAVGAVVGKISRNR